MIYKSDIMDDNTINTDTMIGKVIAVMVALLFVVVLAFPVANSLTVEDGGGGGESEKVMLNTFESTQGVDLSPYNSYQQYFSDTTSTLPYEITYTLEDLNEIVSIWESRSEEIYTAFDGRFITILEAFDESFTGVKITYDVGEGGIGVTIMHNGSGAMDGITDVTSFNLTISVGYQLDCSYTIVYPAGSDPRTESIQTTVTEVKQLSESEDGWMDLSWYLLNDRITVGSEVMLGVYINSIDKEWYKTIMITEDMVSDNHLQFTVDWGDGYTSDVDLGLQSTDMEGVWKFTDSLYEWSGTVKDNGVEIDPNDASCWINYLSTYGYTQSESGSGSEDGTSSTASGVSGISKELVKLVPILLIVGILLVLVMPMIQSRME